MKTWIHTHWRAILLNTLGLAALLAVTRLPRASQFSGVSEPMVAAGIWAARFLLITLAITPLNTVFGWRSLLRLRRTAGLWTFALAALHFGYYVWDSKTSWLRTPIPNLAAGIGLAALVILTALAVTSTNAASVAWANGGPGCTSWSIRPVCWGLCTGCWKPATSSWP
ncbi:MAG: ferric reductase-like transmembrane domain-containing protein [Anaerolineales bacterium]|nr:ferric reductase-like transmembrane domain-containing protein [Anaerolineales bacterium]